MEQKTGLSQPHCPPTRQHRRAARHRRRPGARRGALGGKRYRIEPRRWVAGTARSRPDRGPHRCTVRRAVATASRPAPYPHDCPGRAADAGLQLRARRVDHCDGPRDLRRLGRPVARRSSGQSRRPARPAGSCTGACLLQRRPGAAARCCPRRAHWPTLGRCCRPWRCCRNCRPRLRRCADCERARCTCAQSSTPRRAQTGVASGNGI